MVFTIVLTNLVLLDCNLVLPTTVVDLRRPAPATAPRRLTGLPESGSAAALPAATDFRNQ